MKVCIAREVTMGTQRGKKRQAHTRQGQGRAAKFSLTLPEDVAQPVKAESDAKGVTKAVALLEFARDGIAARETATALPIAPDDHAPHADH
jgi:hypothetical protein